MNKLLLRGLIGLSVAVVLLFAGATLGWYTPAPWMGWVLVAAVVIVVGVRVGWALGGESPSGGLAGKVTERPASERKAPRELIYVGGWQPHPLREDRRVNTLSLRYGGQDFFRRVEAPASAKKGEMVEKGKDRLLEDMRSELNVS